MDPDLSVKALTDFTGGKISSPEVYVIYRCLNNSSVFATYSSLVILVSLSVTSNKYSHLPSGRPIPLYNALPSDERCLSAHTHTCTKWFLKFHIFFSSYFIHPQSHTLSLRAFIIIFLFYFVLILLSILVPS